jgi:hypothetical protein
VAYIVPSDISHLALSGGKSLELDTLRVLKEKLPNDYTVFHGVHWSREYKGHTVYGEVDFVVVNRSGDVLLIEQKNGSLEETGEGLVKLYESGPKNVGDQVRRSLEKIREKFKWVHGGGSRLELDYLIFCPDHRVVDLNAAALDRSRIVDAGIRDRLPERIEEILGPGNPDDDGKRDVVHRFFEQSFEVVPDIHAHISEQEKAFTRLSGGLVDVLKNIEMKPMRLCVDGAAGSGKSAVARYFFDRALAAERRPLLVCFNRPLAEKLKHWVGAGGYVNTWNGLCAKFLEERGHTLDFSQMKGDPDFWMRVQERVVDEEKTDDWLFDTLIVDEGQDFEPLWFDVLGAFLRDDANVLWLQDESQNIRKDGGGVDLEDFVGYRCLSNYRSPESIARFIQRHTPFPFECANDLPGLGVGVSRYEAPEDQPKLVGGIVNELTRRGFKHSDIVILTCRGVGNSVFSERQRVGGQTLRQFTNEYDLFGNQVMTDGRLTFDSIYRFKGQQAPAVVLVDVDPDPDDTERAHRLLHTGMTRATVRLEIVTRDGNPLTSGYSSW